MKKTAKGVYKLLIILGLLLLLFMLLTLAPVSNAVSSVTGIAADKIRNVAKVVVAAGIGVALVGWGIAALALPWLAVPMIIIGLALIAYTVIPLFWNSSSTTTIPNG